MAFNINMDDVNGEIDRLKSLLKEAKKEEEKSEDILQSVKYVKYLNEEVAMSKKQTKLNYDEAQQIWNDLKKGTKFETFINKQNH